MSFLDNTRPFDYANTCMETSWKRWNSGEVLDSLKLSVPARMSYLSSVVLNVVLLPFALIRSIFNTTSTIFRCEWSIKKAWTPISKKITHLILGILGGVIAPSIAYKCRNLNLGPYALAFYTIKGIAVLGIGALVYFAKS